MRHIPFGFMNKSEPVTPLPPPPGPPKYVYVSGGMTAGAPLYSSNFGGSYSTSTIPSTPYVGRYIAIECSANGQYVIYGNSKVRISSVWRLQRPQFSSDYGVTLSNLGSTSSSWRQVAISKNGQYGLATAAITSSPTDGDTNRVMKISNYGATNVLDTLNGTISSLQTPGPCAVSSTGQYQIVMGYTSGGGNIWWSRSSDYGATWTNTTGTIGFGLTFYNGSMSDSGQYVVSSYRNDGSGILVSNDYGATYTRVVVNPSINDIGNVCMSSNGQYIYVLGIDKIYKSINYGVSFSVITVSGVIGEASDINCDDTGQNVYIIIATEMIQSNDYGVTYSTFSNITGENFAIGYE
jgi:hypothetical protein